MYIYLNVMKKTGATRVKIFDGRELIEMIWFSEIKNAVHWCMKDITKAEKVRIRLI